MTNEGQRERDAGAAGHSRRVRAQRAEWFNLNVKPLDQILPELSHFPIRLVKVSSKLIIKREGEDVLYFL